MDLFLLGANLVRCVNAKVSVESLNVRDGGEILRQNLDAHTGAGRGVQPVHALSSVFVGFDLSVIVEVPQTARPITLPGDSSLAAPLGLVARLGNGETDFVLDITLKIVVKVAEVAGVILGQSVESDAVKDQKVGVGVGLEATDDVHESVAAGAAHLSKEIANGHVTTAKRCQIDFDVFYLSKFFLHKYLQVIVF